MAAIQVIGVFFTHMEDRFLAFLPEMLPFINELLEGIVSSLLICRRRSQGREGHAGDHCQYRELPWRVCSKVPGIEYINCWHKLLILLLPTTCPPSGFYPPPLLPTTSQQPQCSKKSFHWLAAPSPLILQINQKKAT
jgi:hypothetical protein